MSLVPTFRRIISLIGITAAFLVLNAHAGSSPFTQQAFDKLLAEGKPVVVDFYADWCPTCKTQKKAVTALLAEPRFKDLTVLVADYDNEKALKKSLRVSSQSTFVVFKAGKEVARTTGQTKPEDIAATLAKAL